MHRFKLETFTGDFFHRKARFERKLAIAHPDVKNGHEKSAVFVALGSNQEDLYKPTMSTSMQLKQITLPLVGECLNVSPHLAASQNSASIPIYAEAASRRVIPSHCWCRLGMDFTTNRPYREAHSFCTLWDRSLMALSASSCGNSCRAASTV